MVHKSRDREDHVSRQDENGHMMFYRIGGESEDCTEVRCMGCGAHHVISCWAFGGYNAAW